MNQDQLNDIRRVAVLIAGFIRNDLSIAEREELDVWIGESADNMILFGRLTDRKNILEAKKWFDDLDEKLAAEKFKQNIGAKQKFALRRIDPAWIAAACIAIITGIAIFKFSGGPAYNVHGHTINAGEISVVGSPGTQRASLLLMDGSTIDLSKVRNKDLRFNDKSQASNLNSVLSYREGISVSTHTLSTPRGGEYQLVLSDGTKVWLNAASSLSYPTSFVDSIRKVELKGEAYFEVAKEPGKTFEVRVGETTVKVTGTRFNVNAYADFPQQVSLLQGAVEVARAEKKVPLSPGEQATIQTGGVMSVIKNSQVASTIAWTHGKFSFTKTPLPNVMQQLERWYDVRTRYRDNKIQEFTGEIYRSSSLQEVLHMLELSTGQHFNINGKLITVGP